DINVTRLWVVLLTQLVGRPEGNQCDLVELALQLRAEPAQGNFLHPLRDCSYQQLAAETWRSIGLIETAPLLTRNSLPPKKIVSPHIPLDFPRTASIAVRVDGPSWVAARLAPSAGLAVVQASRQARCDPEGRRPWPTSKPASKQRAVSRPIPARRKSRLASASAKPDGVIRRHGRGPRRPRPMRQQGFRKQVPIAAMG